MVLASASECLSGMHAPAQGSRAFRQGFAFVRRPHRHKIGNRGKYAAVFSVHTSFTFSYFPLSSLHAGSKWYKLGRTLDESMPLCKEPRPPGRGLHLNEVALAVITAHA